jgi:outer membrane cobalamin receptor
MKSCLYPALIALSSLPITTRSQDTTTDSDGETVVTSSRQNELTRDLIHPVNIIAAREIRESEPTRSWIDCAPCASTL